MANGCCSRLGSFGTTCLAKPATPMATRIGTDWSPQGGIAVEASRNELPVQEPASLDELAHLIAAMRRGDERALEQAYDATVAKLHALASTILQNAADAEEVVCSTYAYAWANAGRFDPERANALA